MSAFTDWLAKEGVKREIVVMVNLIRQLTGWYYYGSGVHRTYAPSQPKGVLEDGSLLQQVADIASVMATPGSWYWNGGTDPSFLYLRTSDGAAPSAHSYDTLPDYALSSSGVLFTPPGWNESFTTDARLNQGVRTSKQLTNVIWGRARSNPGAIFIDNPDGTYDALATGDPEKGLVRIYFGGPDLPMADWGKVLAARIHAVSQQGRTLKLDLLDWTDYYLSEESELFSGTYDAAGYSMVGIPCAYYTPDKWWAPPSILQAGQSYLNRCRVWVNSVEQTSNWTFASGQITFDPGATQKTDAVVITGVFSSYDYRSNTDPIGAWDEYNYTGTWTQQGSNWRSDSTLTSMGISTDWETGLFQIPYRSFVPDVAHLGSSGATWTIDADQLVLNTSPPASLTLRHNHRLTFGDLFLRHAYLAMYLAGGTGLSAIQVTGNGDINAAYPGQVTEILHTPYSNRSQLDRVAKHTRSVYGWTRAGILRVRPILTPPTDTATATFDADNDADIFALGKVRSNVKEVYSEVRVDYGADYGGTLAPSTKQSMNAWVAFGKNILDLAADGAYFREKADSDAAVTTLYDGVPLSRPMAIYDLTVGPRGFGVDLMDTIELTSSRFGLTARKMIVIGQAEDYGRGTVRLTLIG